MEHSRALDILKKDYNFTVISTGRHYCGVCWDNAIVMWYEISSVVDNIHKIRHISAFKKKTYKNLVNYDYSLVGSFTIEKVDEEFFRAELDKIMEKVKKWHSQDLINKANQDFR